MVQFVFLFEQCLAVLEQFFLFEQPFFVLTILEQLLLVAWQLALFVLFLEQLFFIVEQLSLE